jgi:4-hydroxy-2-oxoheptanedioate aldolase
MLGCDRGGRCEQATPRPAALARKERRSKDWLRSGNSASLLYFAFEYPKMSDLIPPTERRKGLRRNLLSDKYEAQGYVIGTFLEIPSPQLVELLGLAGFDFVVIDREHGAIGLERTEELIRAAASTGICPLVRVAECDPISIRQPLDMGAVGIHVPQINSAEMARLAVRSASFYPRGDRGMQPFVRGASYRSYPTAEYLQEANEDTVMVVHIEGKEGVAAFEEIAAVDGVDVAFVGPYDLSQSLGIPGMVESPLIKEKMDQVLRQAKGKQIAVGTYCDDVRKAMEWRKLGVTYLTVSVDAHIFLSAAKRIASQLKQD